jgi:hypothetical protein
MRFGKLWVVPVAFMLTVSGREIMPSAEEKTGEQPRPAPGGDRIFHYRNFAIGSQESNGPLPSEQADVIVGPGEATFSFVSSEMSVGGKVVKGAPYSAEAITETVQALSDGNRITRKNTSSVYRDGEGRTRREMTLDAIGPWAAAGDPPQHTFIDDPVARVHYILEPRNRIARKLPMPSFDEASQVSMGLTASEPKDGKGVEGDFLAIAPPLHAGMREFRTFNVAAPFGKPETESLGKQKIEGLEAEGTRSTITIPAGKIGNELPIRIVSEQWYSPELQVTLLSKHSDPRFGETLYQLTNISRNEPAHSLFEIPSDYEIKDDQPFVQRFQKLKRPKENQ